jgi:LysR family transcriptional regulator of gallate degradation
MKAAALNLRHVRALTAAVKSGSISGAAGALGLSQPAVTQAIARLETVTGTKLLERSRAGTRPTDGGILLAARGEAAAAALAETFRPHRKGGSGGRAGADEDVSMAQLQALLALADAGSYVGGAAATGVTEPSLHRAIGDLERLSGVALVERRGRGVAITAAGERMARAFRIAAAELDAALDELAVLAGRDQGTIRIAAAPAALAQVVPAAIARFTREHPPVTIDLRPGSLLDAEALRNGRLDIIVAPRHAPLPAGITAETLAPDGLAVIARAGHTLAEASPGLARLAASGWAMPPAEQEERSAWERMFLDGGLYPPAVSVTCPDSAALLALVARSDLLTLASPRLLQPGLVQVGDPLAVQRPLVIATRAGWFPTPAQGAFLDELRAGTAEPFEF